MNSYGRAESRRRRDEECDDVPVDYRRRGGEGGKAWKPPEWLKWLTPIVLAVIVGAYSSLSARIVSVNEHIDRLPLDYIPRAELERNAAEELKVTAERNARISRIEDKVDRILQNQMDSGGRLTPLRQ